MMINFKISFQADELLYGDYEKMNLISRKDESNFRNHVQKISMTI